MIIILLIDENNIKCTSLFAYSVLVTFEVRFTCIIFLESVIFLYDLVANNKAHQICMRNAGYC